jgi:2-polyprenyl-6-methoxyphenol hydroxylase-like FAD-dependent oxidoreductase
MTKTARKALIIGAGVAGPVTGIFLKKAGIDAQVFEAWPYSTGIGGGLQIAAGWHDPIPQLLDAAEDIVVTSTLDVATLPTWWRKRTLLIGDAAHATSPHAGQGASLALEDAMRLGRLMQKGHEPGATFEAFEAERRPRVERVVALARRNGNSKRQFSPTGAWIRDRMLKLLLPIAAKGMDWMYAYDPRAA